MLMANAPPKITATAPYPRKRRAATFRFRMFIGYRGKGVQIWRWLAALWSEYPLWQRSGRRRGFFSVNPSMWARHHGRRAGTAPAPRRGCRERVLKPEDPFGICLKEGLFVFRAHGHGVLRGHFL